MKSKRVKGGPRGLATPGRLALLVGVLFTGAASAVVAQGTAFTYQGRLTDNGAPASGANDFRLLLYNASVGGSQVGPTVTRDDVPVASGLFTVTLDFGASAFTGSARWLELAVRPGSGSDSYTVLGSRHELPPAPRAFWSAATPSRFDTRGA